MLQIDSLEPLSNYSLPTKAKLSLSFPVSEHFNSLHLETWNCSVLRTLWFNRGIQQSNLVLFFDFNKNSTNFCGWKFLFLIVSYSHFTRLLFNYICEPIISLQNNCNRFCKICNWSWMAWYLQHTKQKFHCLFTRKTLKENSHSINTLLQQTASPYYMTSFVVWETFFFVQWQFSSIIVSWI